MATADRVREPGFWPTKPAAARGDYVGPAVCAQCHPRQAETQSSTRMARTAMRAEDSEVLRGQPSLQFRSGRYTFAIAKTSYSVTDGSRSAEAPLHWAFGDGRVGQTYLFERGGVLHEARVSYFDSVHGLGFTPARALAAPRDLEEALARPLDAAEARRCFACHTTASTVRDRFEPAGLVLGVTCEACHGPGRAHIAAIEDGRLTAARAAILNPAHLAPADRVDFCGACHATFWDVKLAGEKGIAALRSQPHRLQSSRCWGEGDARVTCTACHDPHRPLVREAAAYDARCLACHGAAAAKPARSCPVAREDCVRCHMPKYEVAEMHTEFTDHRIR
jgi:hypothetical protein